MKKSIPYGRQYLDDEDIDAVVKTLKSDYLTQGPMIAKFEEAFANYVGSQFAVAVSNGTAALHLSALVLNIRPGDKVITTPITFSATANCVRYCGGEVILCDIDPETYLLDVSKLKKLLGSEPKGTIKGIIAVDFAGRAANLAEYRDLANEYDLWIIEDACHAPGGYFLDSNGQKQYCGNGKYSDLSIFSFHPVKHIAAGEGGMITTNDEELYKSLQLLRTHGITKEKENFINDISLAASSDLASDYQGWYMEMHQLGYNYRLTDFQAALGLSQLRKADRGLIRRREIAAKYNDAFQGMDSIRGQSGVIEGHAYHLYILEAHNRLGLYRFLRERQILVQVHYIPLHYMPYYKQHGLEGVSLPQAENYYKHCLSLPMYPTLSEEELDYVIASVLEFSNG